MEKYLTSEQVAQILQVHPFTVLKYLKNGTLEGVKIGRVYRIKESNVEKFLKSKSVTKGLPPKQEKTSRPTEPEPEPELPKPEAPPEPTHKITFEDDAPDTPDTPEDPDEYYKII